MEKFVMIPVPLTEFEELVRSIILSCLQGKVSARDGPTNKWLTHREAAAYLKVTVDVLYKLSSERKLSFSKRGKRNFYLTDSLDKYLSEGTVQTAAELRNEVRLVPRINNTLTKKSKK